MAKKRTAREEIERAFHVSFKLPEQSKQLLDAYKAEVIAESRIAYITGCPYCEHWGPSMGHPECFDSMVNAAKKLRAVAEQADLSGNRPNTAWRSAADLIDPLVDTAEDRATVPRTNGCSNCGGPHSFTDC